MKDFGYEIRSWYTIQQDYKGFDAHLVIGHINTRAHNGRPLNEQRRDGVRSTVRNH
jgi:hypothetical protein